jgi:hypothetical protein
MAKLVGPIKFRGCYRNICFYKMEGKYYVRMKSSLDGKRVKRDPAFRLTMVYAALLGRASKIASAVYKTIPQEEKEKGLYRKLTGKAMLLLKEGRTSEEIVLLLYPKRKERSTISIKKEIIEKDFPFAEEVLKRLFLVPVYKNEAGKPECFEKIPPW